MRRGQKMESRDGRHLGILARNIPGMYEACDYCVYVYDVDTGEPTGGVEYYTSLADVDRARVAVR